MEPLLKAVNLSKSFGTLSVVRRASLAVHPGEVVGLAGRSGSGGGDKSSLGEFVRHELRQAIKQGRYGPGDRVRESEVLAWLGPPEEFLRSEVVGSLGDDATRLSGAIALGNRAQDAFTYQYDRLDGNGTFLILYNRANARLESDLLVVFFDADDRVRELAFRTLSEAP